MTFILDGVSIALGCIVAFAAFGSAASWLSEPRIKNQAPADEPQSQVQPSGERITLLIAEMAKITEGIQEAASATSFQISKSMTDAAAARSAILEAASKQADDR